MKPHKHAELIKAWADGAEIEYRIYSIDSWLDWHDALDPTWVTDGDFEYRIKPEPKPDVKIGYFVDTRNTVWVAGGQCYANLYLTFDGETGKLKDAEVLK